MLLNVSFAEPHTVAPPLIIVTQGVKSTIINCIVKLLRLFYSWFKDNIRFSWRKW